LLSLADLPSAVTSSADTALPLSLVMLSARAGVGPFGFARGFGLAAGALASAGGVSGAAPLLEAGGSNSEVCASAPPARTRQLQAIASDFHPDM
jgi:hypothetical protein